MATLLLHPAWEMIVDTSKLERRTSATDSIIDVVIGEKLPNIKEVFVMERQKVVKLRGSSTMRRLRKILKD